MKEIQIRNDMYVSYCEIQDGEAIAISEEIDGEVQCQIVLIKSVAQQLAKVILEIMGSDEDSESEKK
jgi:hypothetical protein